MTPQPSQIAHFKILAKLGEGGMGAVYRATDTRLNRDVAIKILPDAFAQDAARMQRFEREAQVLATLNHPNIAQIYGIEEGAIVMELVEGQDLPTDVPLKNALEYALQIAGGLEAAHEKGIVHRDLKPANIRVTADGTVKLLDFGLAKAGDPSATGNNTQSPTLSLAMTQAGMIMGTASYMSPEQAAGKPVDRRADIWSFGVVLWEMLSGKRLFEGETVSHTLADVLRAEIDFGKLPDDTPAPLRELLARCLDRDLKTRLRDIGEARIAIQRWLANPVSAIPAAQNSATARRPLAWMFAAVVCASAAIALAVVHFRETPPDLPATRSNLILPPNAGVSTYLRAGRFPAVSPDGRWIAFQLTQSSNFVIAVRRLDSTTHQVLPGTERAVGIFWSPDSRSIAFLAERKLKRVELAGGPPAPLAEDVGNGQDTWGSAGVIVISRNAGPLLRVSASGGTPVPTAAAHRPGARQLFPWFLPDGHHFLYIESTDLGGSVGDVYIGSVDGHGESAAPILRQVSNVAYSQGYLLYGREGNLMAQPFDAGKGIITGPAVPIADQVAGLLGGPTAFSVSANGVLVYQQGSKTGLRSLGWLDRAGKVLETVGEPAVYNSLMLSPDGKQAAVSILEPQGSGRDLWIMELGRGVRTRFTYDHAGAANPVWSPDGKTIVYHINHSGPMDLYRRAVEQSGSEELVLSDTDYKQPTQWTRDGKILFSASPLATADGRLWLIPPAGGQKPAPLFEPSHGESQGQISPDGKWIAYRSSESGTAQIYISPVHGPGGKQRVSTSAVGGIPTWKPDGSELYYIDGGRDLLAVTVKAKGNTLELSTPVKLFGPLPLVGGRNYDVASDGKRFFTFIPEQVSDEPLTLLQNWTALVKK
jgi:Tol biopolymer transport system component/predicted Ser/Thr protein kinase